MEEQIYKHLNSLGSSSTLKNALAYQVYIELTEVKVMYDVSFSYNKSHDIVYLSAKGSRKSKPNIFIPYSTSVPVNMKIIDELQNAVCGESLGKSITLACVEGDSTIVFYTFTKGLIDIQDPEYLLRQKTREERKDFLENEIRKKKYEILAEAQKQIRS